MFEARQEFLASGDAGGKSRTDPGAQGDQLLAPQFVEEPCIAGEHDAQQGLRVEASARK